MQALVVQQELSSAIWLTTGCRPSWIVRWMGEIAQFPAMSEMYELRSVLEGGSDDLCPVDALDPGRVEAAFRLLHDREWLGIEGNLFEFETSEALRSAFYLLDAANRSIEGAQLLLQAYSVLEGMLKRVGDGDTKMIGRAATLLSSGPPERKRLRKRLDAVREFRNSIAHGTRPTWAQAEAAAGLSMLDSVDLVDRNTLEKEVRRQAREYLRCAFGSFLWLSAQTSFEDGKSKSKPLLTKHQIIDLLDACRSADQAERRNADATLSERIPLWLRDPLGRYTFDL